MVYSGGGSIMKRSSLGKTSPKVSRVADHINKYQTPSDNNKVDSPDERMYRTQDISPLKQKLERAMEKGILLKMDQAR